MSKTFFKTFLLRMFFTTFIFTGCTLARNESATALPTPAIQNLTEHKNSISCIPNQKGLLQGYKGNDIPLQNEFILTGSNETGILAIYPKTGVTVRLEQKGIQSAFPSDKSLIFPNSMWISYYYENGFALFNVFTGEKTIIPPLQQSHIRDMKWSRDNQHLLLTIYCNSDETTYLVSFNVETNTYRTLKSVPDGHIISVSPISQSVLRYATLPYSSKYFGGHYIPVSLLVDNLSTSEIIQLAKNELYGFWADFTPDGKSILVMGMDVDVYYSDPKKYNSCTPYFQPHKVYLINLETKERREYQLPVNVINDTPLLSPDGRQLLYLDTEDQINVMGEPYCPAYDFPLYLLDLESGNSIALGINGHNPAWSPEGEKISFLHMDGREQFLSIYDLSLHEIIATYSNDEIGSINSQLYWIRVNPEE